MKLKSVLAGAVIAAGLFLAAAPVTAQNFTASAIRSDLTYPSDYYIYFRWTAVSNACVFFPWTQYIIKVFGAADNLHVITYSGIGWNMPANEGNDYTHQAGPGQSITYYAGYRFYGTGCDYGGDSKFYGTTAQIRPPGALTATDDVYDTKVVLTWGASLTDVPAAQYQYRIFRDNVLAATVASSGLTWTDNNAVPGVTYRYEVAAYAPAWNNTSTRVADNGRAFHLNVRTESLASGVKIMWDREQSSQINAVNYTIERKDGNLAPEFLISINSPTATSWTDPNTGGLPLPGYTYVYIVTPDNGSGTLYRPDSAPGSRLPDGTISGYVKAPFGGGVQGVRVTVTRLDTVAQGESRWTYADTTDANGFYSVPGIYYYDGASFSIVPSQVNHGFRPASETRSLTLAGHTVTNLDFTDTSSFTINCHVRQLFGGDTLDVAGVEIRADGIPRGYTTGANGLALVTVAEIGTHTFTPTLYKHAFSPADTGFYIADNVDELVFYDTTMYELTGTVSGPCSIYIGAAELHVYDSTGGVDTLFTSDQTGKFSIRLPAKKYSVRMNGFTPEDSTVAKADSVLAYFADTVIVSLDTGDAVHAFVYRKTPVILVSGFPRTGCGAAYDSVPILEQAKMESLQVEVRENFGAASCLVDTGFVVVTHDLNGGASRTDTLALKGGRAVYALTPGAPNIIAPHLYLLEMTAHVGGVTAYFSTRALVTGNRPREQTFASVSPSLPFMILRDPPGDGSYSYLSENTSFNTALKLSAKMESSVNLWSQAKLGAKYEAGQFVFTEFSVWGQIKGSLTLGASLATSTELTLKISTSQKFSTSGNSSITGAKGDVFAGAALNMVYAIADVIDYDTAACGVNKTKQLIMAADGFKTTFMYTEDHIRSVLIPQLAQIRDLYQVSAPDSAVLYQSQINVWQQTLDRNDSLKKYALFIENRSFSAGAPYENSLEVATSLSNTIDYTMYMEASLAAELGVEVGGSGGGSGVETKLRMETGVSTTAGASYTRTTGYALSDDDAGDFFSVDVLADLAYAAPVFKLAAGRSSCPWETGTQPRDGVQLSADTSAKTVTDPTGAAVFVLSLGNTSQSDETRTYNLVFLQESNPYGAVLTLGGSQMQGGIPTPYSIPAGGSVNATVTVRKGPSAFQYDGLKFSLSSPCDGSISETIALDVAFCDTCNTAANHAPVISTLVLDTATAGMAYTDTLEASDPDSNQVLLWFLLKGPENLDLNVLTGVMTWTPAGAQAGNDTVRVRASDGGRSDTATYIIHVRTPISAEKARPVPAALSFSTYPNPFNLGVDLKAAVPLNVRNPLALQVYSIAGRLLFSRTIEGAGYHTIQWNGKDARGRSLPTGLYLARLSGGSRVLQKKLLMIR